MNCKRILAALTAVSLTAAAVSVSADMRINGDLNNDNRVNVADLCMMKGVLTGADVDKDIYDITQDGSVNTSDFVMLMQYIIGTVESLPAIQPQTPPYEQPTTQPTDHPTEQPTTAPTDQPTVTPTEQPTTTPVADPSSYMEKVRANIVTPEPADISKEKPGVDYGKVESITYMSTTAGREKRANVILPAGYSTDKKYPVMFVNHGIFGNQDSMLDPSMGIQTISANLAAAGEAEQMIIVLADMFSSKDMMFPSGYDIPTVEGYDAFVKDICDDLIPYIEANYSVKTGRENRAITGFSMGGRESLYIGISRPDVFGYIGGACSAPGITPMVDGNMTHPGSMQESEFKIKDSDPKPYILMLTGAQFDGVVSNSPQKYDEILTKNGTDHIWQEVPNGDHGGVTVRAHFYNFCKAAFRADK